MPRSSEVTFVRINGRVIPIKKRKLQAASAFGAAAILTTGGGLVAADMVKKANFAYGKSANLRGASKLVFSKAAPKYMSLIRESAALRIQGKAFARKGFGALAFGTATAAALASLGIKKLASKKDSDEEVMTKAATASAVAAGIGLAIFGRKTKLTGLVKLAKRSNPNKPVSELFGMWSRHGRKRTMATINKYGKTAYKGVKPKPTSVYNAKQVDLIPPEKKFDIRKWIKKNNL